MGGDGLTLTVEQHLRAASGPAHMLLLLHPPVPCHRPFKRDNEFYRVREGDLFGSLNHAAKLNVNRRDEGTLDRLAAAVVGSLFNFVI